MSLPTDPVPDAATANGADTAGNADAAGNVGVGDGMSPRGRRFNRIVVGITLVVLVVLFVVRLAAAGPDTAPVEAALAKDAALIAGGADAAALAKATCEPAGETDAFDCTPAGGGPAQRFVLADGVLSRALAGRQSTPDPRSGDEVAAALAVDAKARGLGTPSYACATSQRTGPDGAPQPGGPTGLLCVDTTKGGGGEGAARYVELSGGGLLTRDYAVALPPSS